MAMTADEVRKGKCGLCGQDAMLTTKIRAGDEYEYNAFCRDHLRDAVEYIQDKAKEAA